MRFHCGISFSWRTIKKFLIPFILGILAILGFGAIHDGNVPLGFLQVNALEDLDNSYTLLYDDTDYYSTQIDNTYTFDTFVSFLNTLNSSYYKLVISPTIYNNSGSKYLLGFSVGLIPISNNNLSITLFGQNNQKTLLFRSSISFRYYKFLVYGQNITDITSTTSYTNFYNCYINNSCSSYSNLSSSDNVEFANLSESILVDSDNNSLIPYVSSYNGVLFSSIYYSQIPIVLNTQYWTSNSYIFKSIVFNDEVLTLGDEIPTIYDFLHSTPEPEPEPEPTPDPDEPFEDTTEHKALFNKIYWFDDNSTEYGVLTSIYELLFFYCLTMIIFRIMTYIKNMRW